MKNLLLTTAVVLLVTAPLSVTHADSNLDATGNCYGSAGTVVACVDTTKLRVGINTVAPICFSGYVNYCTQDVTAPVPYVRNDGAVVVECAGLLTAICRQAGQTPNQ